MNQDITNPQDLKIEELIEQREQMLQAIEDIKAGVSVFNEEILARLASEKLNGMIVGEHTISKVKRISFSTKIEEARELGATKTKEVLDEVLLKKMYNAGAEIPGVRVTEYIMVKDIQTKAEELSA